MLLYRYKIHLYDLFRFGLKYDLRKHETTVKKERSAGVYHTQVHPPFGPKWLYYDLRVLLSHPVWRDNINAVRLMLQ
jgi:hypothetical protein